MDDFTGQNKPGSGSAWYENASKLANWTLLHFANRRDAWGGYRPEYEIGREFTRADGKKGKLGEQFTAKGYLTRSLLIQHFRGRDRGDIIGLHTADADNLSKWGALDIDYHGPESTAPLINLRAALAWYTKLIKKGFHPLLTESNGKGGYHLRVLLAEPTPADRMYHFLRLMITDHKQLGMNKPPEHFPKQSDVRKCAKGYGNWLRLPGRHHKRDFWSRVWDGERWLDGHEAISFILGQKGDPPSLIPASPPPPPPPPPPTPRRQCTTVFVPAPGNLVVPSGDLANRINNYSHRLPHLGEGQGRDDVAFSFAAFLVRDLALADDAALEWLSIWDVGNRPPKGRQRLSEIISNARIYGQRPAGCGLVTSRGPAATRSKTGVIRDRRRPGHFIVNMRVEI